MACMSAAMPILPMQHKFIKFRCFICICLPFRTSHFSTVLYLDTFLDCHRVIFLAMSFITFCFQSKKALLCTTILRKRCAVYKEKFFNQTHWNSNSESWRSCWSVSKLDHQLVMCYQCVLQTCKAIKMLKLNQQSLEYYYTYNVSTKFSKNIYFP